MSDDLPFDSAGGLSVRYYFPLDAEYVIRIRLGVANAPVKIAPLELRLPVKAGPHTIGVTFPKEIAKAGTRSAGRCAPIRLRIQRASGSVLGGHGPAGGRREGETVPSQRRRLLAPILNLGIVGPYNPTGRGDTPSREKIFVCRPANSSEESKCAPKILARLSRRAYRRPVTDADVRPLTALYQNAREKGDFDYGSRGRSRRSWLRPIFCSAWKLTRQRARCKMQNTLRITASAT